MAARLFIFFAITTVRRSSVNYFTYWPGQRWAVFEILVF